MGLEINLKNTVYRQVSHKEVPFLKYRKSMFSFILPSFTELIRYILQSWDRRLFLFLENPHTSMSHVTFHLYIFSLSFHLWRWMYPQRYLIVPKYNLVNVHNNFKLFSLNTNVGSGVRWKLSKGKHLKTLCRIWSLTL